ncbi:serine/threonine-protein kinase [Streptomyces smyrnaeus]|uniref:serine/threonine-protein kinase n=1 Tax=Streptomyces smyrnaeus TaxID=1387713 RepID=UPI0036BD7CF1
MRSLRADDPERIGEYRLLGRLGEGGMGSVYLAQSPRGRTVAVKLVRRELSEHAEFRHRFEQEIGAARRVGGEWTAPVLDADTEADPPWVATGYIPGITLYEAVAGRKAPLPVRTLRILANRLARALGAIHEAGLIHRDVKPSNILVTIDGPRVIDFGIARALETVADAQLTRTGAVVGSPGFMSPEQIRGDRLTGASDIFSLGSVLAFAATRRTPFGGEGVAGHVQMYRITQEEPDLTGVPDELRDLIAACLAKPVAERPGLPEILDRTADPEDEPGPGTTGAEAAEPWLPGGLVAQLGRHAAQLLDAEVPGAQAAADRAAEAPAVPPRPGAEPSLTTVEPATPAAAPSTPPPGEGSATGAPGPDAPATRPAASEGAEPAADEPAASGTGRNGAPTAGADGSGTDTDGREGSAAPEDPGEPEQGAAGAAPPPPPPAPGGPEMHGMATVTGAGAQHTPPSGQQHTPPSGQWPPPYALHGPAAAPAPERSHGRGMLLGALGVVLAMVSGVGTFVALRVYDKGDEDTKPPSSQQKHSPGTEDDGSGKPSPEDISSPAPGGALPKGYLGAWQGSVQDADGSTITRRFEITQGKEGEVVAKTVNIRADLMCEGEATLIGFRNRMRVTSRITESHPASNPCSPYKEQTLKLNSDGTLSWAYPAGSLSATLRKAGDPAAPVPSGMAGEWKGVNEEGDARTLSLSRGRVGTATMRVTGENDKGGSCEWEGVLGGAHARTLLYGPEKVARDSIGGGCGESGSSWSITSVGDDEIRVSKVREADTPPRVYRRVGSD